MKKKLTFIIIILNVLLMSSCWDFKQIDNHYILTGLAVDQGEGNELIVSTRIPAPITGLQTSTTFTRHARVVSRKGATVLNALQRMNSEFKKDIYLGHLQVVLIGKKAAQYNLERIVDSFSRNPIIQRKLYLIIFEGEAKEALIPTNELDVAPIPDLANMLDINKTNNFIPVTLDEFIFRYSGAGYDAILPLASLSNDVIQINGMAIFKDKKLVGELNGEETRALSLLISSDFTTEYYTVPGENYNNNSKDIVTVRTKRSGGSIKVFLKEDHIEALLKIKVRARITEYPSIQHGKEEEELYRTIENNVENQIRKNLQSVINKSIEYNSDIMGIGKYVRAKYMPYWDRINWDKEYKNTKFKIDIDVELLSTSSTQINID